MIEILKQTINVDQSRIINVGDPTNEYDITNKIYVDSKLTITGSSLNFDNLTLRYLNINTLIILLNLHFG